MPAVKDAKEKIAIVLPWEQQLRLKFRAGVSTAFLLTGNIRDLADSRLLIDRYLCKMFTDPVSGKKSSFDIIIFYDIANGITFPLPEMAERFRKLVEEKKASAVPNATAGIFPAAAAVEDPKSFPKDRRKAFDLIEKALKFQKESQTISGHYEPRTGEDGKTEMHVLFVCDFAESVVPAGQWSSLSDDDRYCIVKVMNWAKDPVIMENGNPFILIAESAVQIHDSIVASGSRVEQCELMLPSPEERLAYIEDLEQAHINDNGRGFEYETGFDKYKFAHLTAGLKKLNIEDMKMMAVQEGQKIGPGIIKARKRDVFKQEYQSVLEIIDPEFGFERIGGYTYLKEYFQNEVIEPMLAGDTKRVPQGILMVGPPGTGKSVMAEALARKAHMNMVKLDIGKMLGSLVGQSEHNMAKALLAIRSLTPVLVWMDEIDQSINRGSTGDSGVSNRLFKQLLEFMGDTKQRGKVLFVAASNRPDMMDPALKRRGRFDKIIPFLLPDVEQRKEIFPAILGGYGYNVEKAIDYGRLAIDSEHWAGSDIEAAVVKSYQISRREKCDKISQAHLASALRLIVRASPGDVQLWSNLALAEVSDLELLPPHLRESFDPRNVQKEIKQQRKDSLTYTAEAHSRKSRDSM
jgi:transitional endoplasmic reticulum ATPase